MLCAVYRESADFKEEFCRAPDKPSINFQVVNRTSARFNNMGVESRGVSPTRDPVGEILPVPPFPKEGTSKLPFIKPVLSLSKEGPRGARGDFVALRFRAEHSPTESPRPETSAPGPAHKEIPNLPRGHEKGLIPPLQKGTREDFVTVRGISPAVPPLCNKGKEGSGGFPLPLGGLRVFLCYLLHHAVNPH